MRKIIIAVVLALTGTLAFAVPALAQPSPNPIPRSTHPCTHGVYSGYCGTQTDLESPPMSMVSGGSAQQNRFVYAKPNSTTNPFTDFFWFRYKGGPSFIAEFTPNGVASNFCVAQVSDLSGLRLRVCNGSTWQQWTPSGPFTGPSGHTGFEWTNVSTGNVIQSNGENMQLRGVEPPASPGDNQLWNFVG